MRTYEETILLILPGRLAPARRRRADYKHHELYSFGRFWYQEIHDFLISKRTVLVMI
jgi:hypothetical protein